MNFELDLNNLKISSKLLFIYNIITQAYIKHEYTCPNFIYIKKFFQITPLISMATWYYRYKSLLVASLWNFLSGILGTNPNRKVSLF